MNRKSLYIIIAGALWGIIALFVNFLKAAGLNSIQCVAARVFFTALIMVIYLFIKDRSQLKIKLRDIWYFIGTGILSIAFFNFCYFEAIEVMGGVAVPALLLYTAPIFVMLLSIVIFKEEITAKKLTALVITFIGLGFVTEAFCGGGAITLRGLLLGLGSGLGYALYSIFGKFLVKKYSAMTITAYTFIIASIGVIPVSGICSDLNLLFSAQGILSAVGLAFFSTVLPFLLYTNGLEGTDAGKASILATVEPFVAAIVGVLVYGESITAGKCIGMILILSAIILLNLKAGKNN